MSLSVRVIPCLDVSGGRVVKGTKFLNLQDAGDPVELAQKYVDSGADELTVLDVSASADNRDITYELVQRIAEHVFIPLTVGGGVRSVKDVDLLLRSGADKVGINSAAIARPELIDEIAARFGAQVVVLSLDIRRSPSSPSGFTVTTHGGKRDTGIDAIVWAKEAVERGAGELLVNSMDTDGTKEGFDLPLIERIRNEVSVPVIASGGAGKLEDFAPAVRAGADAVLAASVFHYGLFTIAEVKEALSAEGIRVRQ